MKYLQINCEFSDFLMALAKTFRFCETPDSEDCFQLAKDNLYTYRHEPNGDEYEDEELMLLYHDKVEITFLDRGKHYGREFFDIGLEFPSQNGLQFTFCYYGSIEQLFGILIKDCTRYTDEW